MSDAHVTRVANLVGALALAVDDRVRHAAEEVAGHGAAGPAALVALHQFAGGWSVDDLRGVLGLTHSGCVRLVDRLAADGYVERRPGASRREVAVHLTASGRRVAARVLAARAMAVERVLESITERERAQLARLTEKLLSSMARDRVVARRSDRPPADGWMCRLCDLGACGRPEGRCPAATGAASVL